MKKGLTLIEVLVVIGLTSAIALVALTLLVFTSTRNTQGNQQEVLEQIKNDVATELSATIRWGYDFSCTNCDGTANATLSVDNKTSYYISGVSLVKKDLVTNVETALTPSNAQVTGFKVSEYLSAVDNKNHVYPSYKITVDLLVVGQNSTTDTLNIVVSNRKQSVTL